MVRRSHGVCERCHARVIHARSRWSLCEVCRAAYVAERKKAWRKIKIRRAKKAGR